MYKNFDQQANELCSFLVRAATTEGGRLHQAMLIQIDQVKMCMDTCIHRLKDISQKLVDLEPGVLTQQQTFDTVSQNQSRSRKSTSSNRSLLSIQAQKRAKADAAMAKLTFSAQEAELRKQQAILSEQEQLNSAKSIREKAIIDAELKLINDKKEIAAAVAEADALDRNLVPGLDMESMTNRSLRSLGTVNSMERVRQYIQNQCASSKSVPLPVPHNVPPLAAPSVLPYASMHLVPNFPPTSPSYVSPSMNDISSNAAYNGPSVPLHSTPFLHKSPKPQLPVKDEKLDLSQDLVYELQPEPAITPLNPSAKTFVPTSIENAETKAAAELGQFFLKKELLISRLTEFNEKPETYEAWKISFKRLVTDLKMTPSDELEMLGKWLGPTSKKYAESTRVTLPEVFSCYGNVLTVATVPQKRSKHPC